MQNEPMIESRSEQPYIGTRTTIAMSDFPREIPAMTARVSEWLSSHDLRPSGKPFLRYHVIDMPDRLDVELGIPVDSPRDATGEVQSNVLPEGRYAVLAYRGVKNGIPANKKLLGWIAEHDEEVVSHESQAGEVFEARYETFMSDAQTDQDQLETEVAIKLRS